MWMFSAKFDDRHFVRGQSLTSAGAKTAIKTSRCRSCAGDADMKSIYTCSIVGVIISQMPDAYIEYIVYTCVYRRYLHNHPKKWDAASYLCCW